MDKKLAKLFEKVFNLLDNAVAILSQIEHELFRKEKE